MSGGSMSGGSMSGGSMSMSVVTLMLTSSVMPLSQVPVYVVGGPNIESVLSSSAIGIINSSTAVVPIISMSVTITNNSSGI